MNKLFFNIVLTIGVLVFSGNAFSQTTEIMATDSTSVTKTIVVDSIATKKIVVADSTSKSNKRWQFGMGFVLNFVGGTNINLSPNLTYAVSHKVSFGVGLQGGYTSIKNLQSTTTFGFNLLSQYCPAKKIMTLLEFVQLNVSTKRETPTGEIKNKFWDTAMFIGAGYNITDKIAIGAKYNMLYKEDESVYTSAIVPFVNIGF